MPVDKQNNNASQVKPAKPTRPLLSFTPRNAKSPLTPLPAKVGDSPQSSPATTNSSRRSPHADSPTLAPVRTKDAATSRPVNGNATPQPGHRRAKTAMDSPSASATRNKMTPTAARPTSLVETRRPDTRNERRVADSGRSSQESGAKSSPMPRNGVVGSAGASSVPLRMAPQKETLSPAEGSPQFFHADDAKPAILSHAAGERPKLRPKAATYAYANGDAKGSPTFSTSRAGSPIISRQDGAAKFFRANDLLTRQSPGSRLTPSSKPAASATSSPRFQSPTLHKAPHPPARAQTPKNQSSLTSPLANAASPAVKITSSPISQPHRDEQSLPRPIQEQPLRRPSVDLLPSDVHQLVHRKSMSLDSPSPNLGRKPVDYPMSVPIHIPEISASIMNGTPSSRHPTQATPSLHGPRSLRSTSLGSSNTIQSSIPMDSSTSTSTLPLLSPVKSIDTPQPQLSQLQKMNELAASARRERKVLDLEISNSSLLAINRTLEREMRKQSNELRRFRRLSRSGGLSLAANSMRSVSGQSGLSTLMETDDGRSDLSDLDEISDDGNDLDDEDLDSSFDDDSSSILSPTSRAEHDATHRASDEKRLMLDLSKHRQLLVDSQRMNTSIRRCMGLTEELIKEGNKALAYQVKVSDVELGGRVLSRTDDVEDDFEDNIEEEVVSDVESEVELSGRVLGRADDTEDEVETKVEEHSEDQANDDDELD